MGTSHSKSLIRSSKLQSIPMGFLLIMKLGGPMEQVIRRYYVFLTKLVNYIDNQDPKEYNPPTILSPMVGGFLVGIKDVVVISLLYFFVYYLLQFSKRFTKGEISYKNHFIAIFASIIIFGLVTSSLKGLLKKYIPS